MPLRSPTTVADLDMLIDGYYPDCDYLNVHAIDIAAAPDAVWDAIPRALVESAARPVIAWPLALAAFVRGEGLHRRPTPAPPPALAEGVTLGPWRVEKAVPQREVIFLGAHRFSRYAAGFYLERTRKGTRLYQVTRADFPGLAARLYLRGVKLFHDPIIEAVLRRIRRFAEEASP